MSDPYRTQAELPVEYPCHNKGCNECTCTECEDIRTIASKRRFFGFMNAVLSAATIVHHDR